MAAPTNDGQLYKIKEQFNITISSNIFHYTNTLGKTSKYLEKNGCCDNDLMTHICNSSVNNDIPLIKTTLPQNMG